MNIKLSIKRLVVCSALALLSFTPQAYASVVSQNSSYGIDTITLDTTTGLKFLDVNLSQNLSVNYVSARFGVGQQFAGYRYATKSEIHTLFLDGGVSTEPLFSSSSPSDVAAVTNLISLLGKTYDEVDGGIRIFGIAGFNATVDEYSNLQIQPSYPIPGCPCANAYVFAGTVSGLDVADPKAGSFLVATSAVPEPSTWAMMILGFAGLGFMAYRRRNSTMLAA